MVANARKYPYLMDINLFFSWESPSKLALKSSLTRNDKFFYPNQDPYENGLRSGLLKEKPYDENILIILRKNSEESLMVADLILKENLSSLWVIVSSYYSMYYIAIAVLFKVGYNVGSAVSHKVTSDALIVFC